MQEHLINAEGKSVGRVASEAAVILRGKTSSEFERNIVADVRVRITNASRANVSERKAEGTVFTRYSGYPGGLYFESLGELAARKGYAEIFRKAVYGMLPGNKLRSRIMRNLSIEE